MSANPASCQNCEAPLPPDVSGSVCPACLVGEVIDSLDTVPGGADTALPAGSNSRQGVGSDSLEGTTLGIGDRYKILQRIGEGGFGTVYMAEQTDPVRRRVAIKILKAGMDTHQLLARFEAERQALAMMDHPNIARVLDGGETEQGRPFFVMDLVRGDPITKFCDEESLPPGDRLQLFVKVCRAVQHAHQKGIIHRDLKPSNILVTVEDGAEPVPKVIDFGVAKAMESNLTEKTLFTRFEQMIGTPAYMSPEQAGTRAAHDIDTRADIYALGVLLYELLTGTTPFDGRTLQSAAFDEVRRILREEEAPRPSARLSSMEVERRTTIAKDRGTEASSLGRHLRGDLDWIVMKAIEKDRRRRYETANALAADVERHLANEPVTAGPPTVRYRFAKFLMRNKTAVAVVAVILISLIGGLALAALGFASATQEAELARAAEETAEEKSAIASAINEFLVDDILGQALSDEFPEPDLTIKTALERAAERADARFGDQPIVLAEICLMLRHAYNRMSLDQRALAQALKAYRIFLSELGEDSPRTLRARRGVGKMMLDLGMLEESAEHLQATLEKQRELLGELHVDTMSTLHMAIFLGCDVKSLDEAVPHAREFAENAQLVFKDNPAMKFEARRTLAWVLMRNTQSDQKEIEELLVGAEAEAAEVLGDTPSVTRNLRKTLAGFYKRHRRFTEAEALWRLVIETEESMVGSNSPRLMSNYRELADVLAMQDKNKESQVALQRAMDLARINASETHIFAVANVILDQSRRLRTQGRGEEARDLIRDMRPRILEGCTGDISITVEKALLNELAQTHVALKDYSTAEEVLREPARDLVKADGLPVAFADPNFALYVEVCLILGRGLEETLVDLNEVAAKPVTEVELDEYIRGARRGLASNLGAHVFSGQIYKSLELEGYGRLLDPGSPAVAQVLVPPTSEWRWFHPMDGVDPAEADPDFHDRFFRADFDDSAWTVGTDSEDAMGGFGYGDEGFTGVDIGTPTVKALGKSAYFRHRFTTEKEFTLLELRFHRDDGTIVYLDGEEVGRDNMTEGNEAFELPALWTVTNKAETGVFRLSLKGFTLPPGEHVLAISLHNTYHPSSDLRIGAITLVAVEPDSDDGD